MAAKLDRTFGMVFVEVTMATAKINDETLATRLLGVFQTYGYEGASLSRIAEATGLGRASLYHRFPGGKVDMARAVFDLVDARFTGHVLAPLLDAGTPAERVRRTARRISEFYSGGERSCVLDTLSIGQDEPALRQRVRASLTAWRDAMAKVAQQAGATPRAAQALAEDALVRIQGALVVARGTADARPFKRVLRELPRLLAGEASS